MVRHPRADGERIERLLEELRRTVDERAWGVVEDLVLALTDLYGGGLTLAVSLGGPDLAAALAADPLGHSLLVLHGLHPDDLASPVVEHKPTAGPTPVLFGPTRRAV